MLNTQSLKLGNEYILLTADTHLHLFCTLIYQSCTVYTEIQFTSLFSMHVKLLIHIKVFPCKPLNFKGKSEPRYIILLTC